MNWILTEYDEEQHIANEKRWSLEEGVDKVSQFYAYLLEHGREDDMKRCLKDKIFRKKLMAEIMG